MEQPENKGALILPSVDLIRRDLVRLDEEMKKVKARVDAYTITDEASAGAIIETRKQAKDIYKEIESNVASKIGHIKKLVADVNAVVKYYRDSIDAIVEAADGKIKTYQRQRQIEEAELRRKQQELIDKENERLRKLAEKKKVEPPPMIPPAPIIEEPKKTLATASGAKATMVDRWTFEVMNKEGVPEEYKMVDDKAVNAAIRQGVREIPGLRIFNDPYIKG
jgi:seryl-tRNA synthetase